MDQNGKDDLKTQFVTREGTYRLITLSEYSRPNRVGYQSNQNNPQVRVSLITLPAIDANATTSTLTSSSSSSSTTTATTTTTTTTTTTASATIASSTITAAATTTNTNACSGTATAAVATTTTTAAVNNASAESVKYLPHQSSLNATNAAISLNGTADAQLSHTTTQSHQLGVSSDRICFNFGKELYVYSYRGVRKNVDLCKPIDKKLYKGTSPSCHDFNETVAVSDSAPLLVGFTTGQIQLVQPGKRETGRLYNEERLIDKTKVTCLKWLPKSPNLFLASHASGHLYLYNEELPCTPTAPNYQNFKSGDGFTILTCKSKSTRNPLYKWTFNTDNCSINEFCFSPCGSMLAIVSQDGFLRVFHYDTMELLGLARSYFGGFLCVCWSPDAKYIVVGGEDDLVTIWSLQEKRVVARGQGHRSWVSVVAFDPYTSYSHCDSSDFSDDETAVTTSNDIGYNGKCSSNTSTNYIHADARIDNNIPSAKKLPRRNSTRNSLATSKIGTSYRLGSVGQDTQLCLWDITEDILRQSYEKRHRLGSHDPQVSKSGGATAGKLNENDSNYKFSKIHNNATATTTASIVGNDVNAVAHCSNSESNKYSNSSNKFSGKTNVMENCVDTKTIVNCNSVNNETASATPSTNTSTTTTTAAAQTTTTTTTTTTTNMQNDISINSKSGKSSNESGMTALNTLTQRLSSFSFINDKKSSSGGGTTNSHSHKKTFPFSKSSGNHSNFLYNNSSSNNGATGSNGAGELNGSAASLKNGKNAVPSYDAIKLIGTNACPRFDECPLLEPLVCKKIAHERLTALIFREDCFLTACQDGFIYTWARPGFSNMPQHNMGSSPTAPTGGTVV